MYIGLMAKDKLFETPDQVFPSAEVPNPLTRGLLNDSERAKQIDDWLERRISEIPDTPRETLEVAAITEDASALEAPDYWHERSM